MRIEASKIALIVAVIFALPLCKPRQERLGEYKLMRYKQLEQVEKQLASIVRLVKLQSKSGTNALIKAKYRKDLGRAYAVATDRYGDSNHVAAKIARITKGKVTNYDRKKNTFNEGVQLGFSIENESYKRTFLDALVGKEISISGRVLNASMGRRSSAVKVRVPFTNRVTQTDRLVLTYVTAQSYDSKTIKKIRRYHDVTVKLDVENVSMRESDNFIVIKVSGRLKKVSRLGWLGITTWKDEPAFLPMPTTAKSYSGKKKKKGSKSSSDDVEDKVAATTTKKSASSTAKKTSLEDDWEDDSDDF